MKDDVAPDSHPTVAGLPETHAHSPALGRLLAFAQQDVPSTAQLNGIAAGLDFLPAATTSTQNPTDLPQPPPAPGPYQPLVGNPTPAALPVSTKLWAVLALTGLGGLGGVWAVLSAFPHNDVSPLSTPASSSPPSNPPLPAPSPTASVPPPVPASGATPSVSTEAPLETIPKASKPPSELSLLRQAQRRLDTAPAISLKLCQRHAQLYPQGQLAQEREVLRIEALKRLNRQPEAEQSQQRFKQSYPESAHQPRINDALPASSR